MSLSKTPLISEKYDRFCTRCSSVIPSAARKKFDGEKCPNSACNHPVECRRQGDKLWSRCGCCDVFLRCSFKFCYVCGLDNYYFDEKKESRLYQADLESSRFGNLDVSNSRSPEAAVKSIAPKPGITASSSSPLTEGHFDRHCTSCGFIMVGSALYRYRGHKCLSCKHVVEFRDASDGMWDRCTWCDCFIKCTYHFCYFCGSSNDKFDEGREDALAAERRRELKRLLDEEEEELSQLKDPEISENDEATEPDLKKKKTEKDSKTEDGEKEVDEKEEDDGDDILFDN